MANLTVKHWGEIEEKPFSDNYVPDVTVDIEKSMNKFCLAEFDARCDESLDNEEAMNLQLMDPLMLYAISLHKYTNDMSEKIRVAELAIESNVIPPADAAPPIPGMPEIPQKRSKNYLNYVPVEYSSFHSLHNVKLPELSIAIVRSILSKSVATMFAHIGYESSHQSVLDLMVDVLIEFLRKISYSLKVAQEDEEKGYLCGFPNIAEKILVELGVGGTKGLQDYYNTKVIKYINVLQKRCKELNSHYENLLSNKSSLLDDKNNEVIRVKVEDDDDVVEVDNTQVHLAIDGDIGFSSLDAGYQLLNSLEAGTNAQGVGIVEEDANIIISSNIPSIPEAEMSSMLSPFNKKKRTK